MQLKQTIDLMCSPDYKKRLTAEYFQLKIRTEGLKCMLTEWDKGCLTFKPTCPRSTYMLQLKAMEDYLAVLELRITIENLSV